MNQDFNNYSSSVNIDEIWNAIEPQVDALNAKRKWKLLWSRLAFASLLALSLALFFFWWNNSSSTAHAGIANQSIETSPSKGAKVLSANENNKKEDFTPTENLINNKNKESALQNIESANVSKNAKNLSDFKVNRISNNSKQFSTASTLSNISSQENLPSDAKSDLANVSIVEHDNKADKEPNFIFDNETSSTNIYSDDRKSLDENSAPSTLDTPESTLPQSSPIANLAVQEQAKSLAPLPIVSILDIPTEIALSAPPYEKQPLSFVEDNDLLISIIAEAGIGKAMRTLELKENGNQQIFDLRKNNGKSLEFIQAALLARVTHPSGFYLASGAGYGQINDVYENRSIVYDTTITEGIVSKIVDLNGDTTDVYGPVETYLEKQINKKFYTTYRMIDIPVYLGFAYQFNEWETDFSFGYIANLSLMSSGKIPNSAVDEIELADDSDNVLVKSKISHSFELAFGVNRQVGERMYVGIKPTMRIYPKSFTTDDYGIYQKYITIGLKMGLRYDLN